MARTAGGPVDPVDCHVGVRIRLCRKEADLSQQALADAIGVTFQQVQKYERGSNRVSASMLHRVATCLGVEVAHFFEGIETTRSGKLREPTPWAATLAHLSGVNGGPILARHLTQLTAAQLPLVCQLVGELVRGNDARRAA